MEECSLCGRAVPHYSTVRCFRCRKTYCRSCVTFTWYRNVLRHVPICLNCARALVSPSTLRRRTKYSPLREYLARRPASIKYATLTFAEIEKIIEDRLPSSALQHQHWWGSSDSSVQAQSWLYAGWQVQAVNLKDRTVIFRRIKTAKTRTIAKQKKRSRALAKKAFQPPSPKTPRRKIPSKTKIATAIARLRNVERRKSSMRRYRGKFKPQPAFEKRLYKPYVKPKKSN